jgi:hypothetical protein
MPNTPIPARLAESLIDIGHGFTAEVAGAPDPAVGNHIKTMARRVASRITDDDQRLTAFADRTDTDGYVWFDADILPYLTEAAAQPWSFERWFTGLAQAMARLDPMDPDDITEMQTLRRTFETIRDQGYSLVRANRETGQFTFTREN